MTETSELLNASPARAPVDVDLLAAAIDACLRCLQSCTTCSDADLAEPDVTEMATCAALCVRCADVCTVTARVVSRPAHWDAFVAHRLLQACVRACTQSAEECHRHAPHHRHCALCEQVCRACIDACNALLDSEAFKTL